MEDEIAKNAIIMRHKTLCLELDIIRTYSSKNKIIVPDNELKYKLHTIESNLDHSKISIEFNYFDDIEEYLSKAEAVSSELMGQVKALLKSNAKKVEVKKQKDDIIVPDYRSVVTVRGTKEDVANCIIKAQKAFDKGDYRNAKRLLEKAERMFPTKNARELLKQVLAAMEPKPIDEDIEVATEAVEELTIDAEQETTPEGIIDAAKCVKASDDAFVAGKFEKAERLLHRAKRLDPSLNIEGKLHRIKTAEEAGKEAKIDIEKEISPEESINAAKCMKASDVAFDAGKLEKAERLLNKAKRIDSSLNIESKLHRVKNALAAKKEEEDRQKRIENYENAGKCLYTGMKLLSCGDYKNAEATLLEAENFDPELKLTDLLSEVRCLAEQGVERPKINEQQYLTENDIKLATHFLQKAIEEYGCQNYVVARDKLCKANFFDPSLVLDFIISRCNTFIASRSSTEHISESTVLEECYSQELSGGYCKRADEEHKNGNLIESRRLLCCAYVLNPSDSIIEQIKLLAIEIKDGLASERSISNTGDITKSETLALEDKVINDDGVQDQKQNVENKLSRDEEKYVETHNLHHETIGYEVNNLGRNFESDHKDVKCNSRNQGQEFKRTSNRNQEVRLDTRNLRQEVAKYQGQEFGSIPYDQAGPSHEITNSETEFMTPEDKRQIEEAKCTGTTRKYETNNIKPKPSNLDKVKEMKNKKPYEFKNENETSSKHNPEQLLKEAHRLIKTGDLETAKNLLHEAKGMNRTVKAKTLIIEVEEELRRATALNQKHKSKPDSPPKHKQTESLIDMAESAMKNKEFDKALDFLHCAEETYPTDDAKKLINEIHELLDSQETLELRNVYESPIECNETDRIEAEKCLEIGQKALEDAQFDRAERFFRKAKRICKNDSVDKYLEQVSKARNQHILTSNNENAYDIQELNKFIRIATEALIIGNFAIAECFYEKAFSISPTDDSREILNHIKNVKSLIYGKTCSTTQAHEIDEDTNLYFNTCVNKAIEFIVQKDYILAKHYFGFALKNRQDNEINALMLDVLNKIEVDGFNTSEHVNQSTAKKLLNNANQNIEDGNLELAESCLVLSWNMRDSRAIKDVYKKLLQARIVRFEKSKHHDKSSRKVHESDKLILQAIVAYEKDKLHRAQELLIEASKLSPCLLIDELLDKVETEKNKTWSGSVQKFTTKIRTWMPKPW